MTAETLLALAERCEKAEGGWRDPALDADIYEALGYQVIRARSHPRAHCWRHRGHGPLGFESHWVSNRPFTYSLDAALVLMPEGRGKSVTDADNGDALAETWTDEESTYARAKTWPLAMTAAALRARAASVDTHPKDGDALAAPLVSGAVPKADAQNQYPPPRRGSERDE